MIKDFEMRLRKWWFYFRAGDGSKTYYEQFGFTADDARRTLATKLSHHVDCFECLGCDLNYEVL